MPPRSQVLPPAMAETPPSKGRGVNVVSMKSRGVVSQPEDRHRSRPADRPFLLEHDILRVENVDDVTWRFKWDRKKYDIRPDEIGFVPFPAVVLMMGDPRSQPGVMTRYNTDDGQRGVVLTRYEELCRLFAHYGIEQESIEELIAFAPRLKVETMQGETVIFPAQDPEMIGFPVPNAPLPGRENTDLRRLADSIQQDNERMSAELADLRALVGQKLGGTPSNAVDEDDVLAAALTGGGGATADTGPQTRL